MQVIVNNRQVYHLAKTSIDLDVNSYLTFDPKVNPLMISSLILVLNVCSPLK